MKLQGYRNQIGKNTFQEIITLKTTKSALAPSMRLDEITHDDTGHFSLMKTPRPGLRPPQDPNPFHIRMVLRGASESSMFSGINPSGGTYISCSGILSSPSASLGRTLAILTPVSSETLHCVGRTSPSFMYHGRWGMSGILWSLGSKIVPESMGTIVDNEIEMFSVHGIKNVNTSRYR